MSTDIFFSQVNLAVQNEIKARAKSGLTRSTTDLQFMLGKIANIDAEVKIQYTNEKNEAVVVTATTPQRTPSSGSGTNLFSPNGPNGYLSSTFTSNINGKNNPIKTNTPSGRTPYFISTADINFGNSTYGSLNTANLNIKVPKLEDIDLVENMFMIPGQEVTLYVYYPDSACLTFNDTNGGQIDSRIDSIGLSVSTKLIPENYFIRDQKLHEIKFTGLITGFDIQYNMDYTADVMVQLTGASIIAANISLLANQTTKSADGSNPALSAEARNNAVEIEEGTAGHSFFKELQTEVNNIKEKDIDDKKRVEINAELANSGFANNYLARPGVKNSYVVWGKPTPTNTTSYTYITLGYLIDFINRKCLTRIGPVESTYSIIFNEQISKSIYYPELVSADPEFLFFPGQSDYNPLTKWYSTFNWEDGNNKLQFLVSNANEIYCQTPNIFINLDIIKSILKLNYSLKIHEFLDEVSKIVYDLSGHAIDLKLTSHPYFDSSAKSLIWYDINFLNKTGVTPFMINLTSTGSAVTEFNIKGQLPKDASTISFLTNEPNSKIAESNIAPYISFMYSKSRLFPANGSDGYSQLIRSELDTSSLTKKLNEDFKANHLKFVENLKITKTAYSVGNKQTAINLQNALRKYVQYPTTSIESASNLAAPMLPIDVTFTMDGINGLKFGDIVTFDIIPTRYIENSVFVIVDVTHTITSDGKWTTTCRCGMKPNIRPSTL